MRLHRPRYTRTSFGAPTRDIQDYNIEARLESLPDSTNRLDTREATDEGMTPQSSIFAYPVPAKKPARRIHEARKAQHFDLE
jgi:hypothetical protein